MWRTDNPKAQHGLKPCNINGCRGDNPKALWIGGQQPPII